jgi:hypothetical protein
VSVSFKIPTGAYPTLHATGRFTPGSPCWRSFHDGVLFHSTVYKNVDTVALSLESLAESLSRLRSVTVSGTKSGGGAGRHLLQPGFCIQCSYCTGWEE